MSVLKSAEKIAECVEKTVRETPVLDVHTHLYPASFGELLLWGIDELLTYHYLVAEVFRRTDVGYDAFWKMSKTEQADLIWRLLFVENSPISEACRGPLTVLKTLGVDVGSRDLKKIRKYFARQTPEGYVDTVFELGKIRRVVMTNDPFDPTEYAMWDQGVQGDERFATALRIDALLNNWPQSVGQLHKWGYDVKAKIDWATIRDVRRFLMDWIERIHPLYLAASLPPDFAYPEKSVRAQLLAECVLPVAHKAGIPFAMMIGVKKLVNPELRLAGDSVGPADGAVLENLCRDFPDNRFLVTLLARENQHQLCVIARKFGNLMPFGCWWFLNDPSLVEELTRMRTELIGLSYIPQHSDARVLDQLIYKWEHSRRIIASVLTDKYQDLAETGWYVTSEDIRRDVSNLFGGNFERFLAETPRG